MDDLTAPTLHALLAEHLCSMHALDLDALGRPEISFWSCWSGAGDLMGCGALKTLDATHSEVKSTRTATAHLRRRIARTLLEHIVA